MSLGLVVPSSFSQNSSAACRYSSSSLYRVRALGLFRLRGEGILAADARTAIQSVVFQNREFHTIMVLLALEFRWWCFVRCYGVAVLSLVGLVIRPICASRLDGVNCASATLFHRFFDESLCGLSVCLLVRSITFVIWVGLLWFLGDINTVIWCY
jgi:hypothetical protein